MINLASLIACNARQFPNIREVLQILVVMPLTSCEAERSNIEPTEAVEELLQIYNEGEEIERLGTYANTQRH